MFTILSPQFRCSLEQIAILSNQSYSTLKIEWTQPFVTGVFSLSPIYFPSYIFSSSSFASSRFVRCFVVQWQMFYLHIPTLYGMFFLVFACWMLGKCSTSKWVYFSKLKTMCIVQCSLFRGFFLSFSHIEILQRFYGWFCCLFTTKFYVSAIL